MKNKMLNGNFLILNNNMRINKTFFMNQSHTLKINLNFCNKTSAILNKKIKFSMKKFNFAIHFNRRQNKS